jgi:hypothetical protein
MYRRLLPPPAETVNHAFIIETIIRTIDPLKKSTYIEYGVRDASVLNHVSKYVHIAYGVDINPTNPVHENVIFKQCTTDYFSETFLPHIQYDFAFIDADHRFESVIKDFNYVFKNIKVGGYIFLHDTYPCSEDYLSVNGSADCYKTPIEIKKQYTEGHDLEIFTFPLNPGVTIVRKLR